MHNFSEVLATQISSEARGKVPNMTLYDRRDTTVYYAPYNQSASIIAFTSAMPRQRDSVTAACVSSPTACRAAVSKPSR